MAQEQKTIPLVSDRPMGPNRKYLSDDEILNAYYRQGWRFSHTKQNGDVVIVRDTPEPSGRKSK